jgi:hypothetical protein
VTSTSRHISAHIDRSPVDVYLYASEPANLPHWASGIGDSIELEGEEWVIQSAAGRMIVAFAAANPFGVLDHVVTMNTGESFYNPMRVLEHDGGSEVVFSLRRVAGQDDEAFETDAATIAADLERLKGILEA